MEDKRHRLKPGLEQRAENQCNAPGVECDGSPQLTVGQSDDTSGHTTPGAAYPEQLVHNAEVRNTPPELRYAGGERDEQKNEDTAHEDIPTDPIGRLPDEQGNGPLWNKAQIHAPASHTAGPFQPTRHFHNCCGGIRQGISQTAAGGEGRVGRSDTPRIELCG